MVTFLFTDVEGSTRRWEADADGMRVALAAHDEVLRRRSRRTAASCSSTPGTACAPRSRRRARRWMPRWPRSGRWSCRCGWGWRPAKPSCGTGDYFGAVLNRAARVMAAGHGGQILLAESTAGLLSGVDLRRSGAAAVAGSADSGRGVPGPSAGPAHGLPAVAGAGCESGEPAACDHQLHRARVRGRRDRQRRCKAHRLVTLTGVGGVGKTRLALEVAARLADEFPDGVWLFELAAVTDPAAVPDAVAAVLGITQQPGKSVSE